MSEEQKTEQIPEPVQSVETFHQRLKRLSQSPRIGDRFVKGAGLGPIAVHSLPASEPESSDELSP
jgi:hypothetical protein